MDKLISEKGLSRIEIICIVGILLVIGFIGVKAIQRYGTKAAQTQDEMLLDNAKRLAEANAMVTGCPVNDY